MSRVIKKKSNLLDLQYSALVGDEKRDYLDSKKYFDIQTLPVENGYVEKLVEIENPITPEYVNSFADLANYKKNLSAAISGNSKGSYGDFTSLQDFASLDSSEQLTRIKESKEKLELMEKFLKEQKSKEKEEELDESK